MSGPSQIVVCATCQSPNRIPTARLGDQPRCGKCKELLFTGRPIALSDQTFDRHLTRSEIPLVVDFWAEWCGPCKMIAPILEEIAAEHSGAIAVAKLNVDENPDMAMKFSVMSIPTLLVFHNGEVSKRLIGAKSKGALLQELDEFLVTSH